MDLQNENLKSVPFISAILALILPLIYNHTFHNYYATYNLLPLLMILYVARTNYIIMNNFSNDNVFKTKTFIFYSIVLVIFTFILQGIGDNYPIDFVKINLSSGAVWDWIGLEDYGFFHNDTLYYSKNLYPDIGFYFLLVAILLPMYWIKVKNKELLNDIKNNKITNNNFVKVQSGKLKSKVSGTFQKIKEKTTKMKKKDYSSSEDK